MGKKLSKCIGDFCAHKDEEGYTWVVMDSDGWILTHITKNNLTRRELNAIVGAFEKGIERGKALGILETEQAVSRVGRLLFGDRGE